MFSFELPGGCFMDEKTCPGPWREAVGRAWKEWLPRTWYSGRLPAPCLPLRGYRSGFTGSQAGQKGSLTDHRTIRHEVFQSFHPLFPKSSSFPPHPCPPPPTEQHLVERFGRFLSPSPSPDSSPCSDECAPAPDLVFSFITVHFDF